MEALAQQMEEQHWQSFALQAETEAGAVVGAAVAAAVAA